MISTEIYLENYQVDLIEDISTDFTYTVDDIKDFGAKNTSFSKTISLPGTAKNNKIFGFIFDLGNSNLVNDGLPNINSNFNAAKTTNCRIFIDKIQIFKGVLRLLEIVNQSGTIEYQCNVNGDLGGFISDLGNKKLEDLDFSDYDEVWNFNNITSSWDSVSGSGVYYPLIDIGSVSNNAKTHFQYKAFKPAFYVKEYLEKIIANTNYTWDFSLLNTDLFKRLIIPCNQKVLSKVSTILLDTNVPSGTYSTISKVPLNGITLGSFTITGGDTLVYGGASAIVSDIKWILNGSVIASDNIGLQRFRLYKNGVVISYYDINITTLPSDFLISISLNNITINPSDDIYIAIDNDITDITFTAGGIIINSNNPVNVPLNLGDNIEMNYAIPKGIYQKDFFISICKMFNLYVYDDQFDENKLHIKPYIDFYSGLTLDWTNKVDRSKAWSIKPMSELNSRFYQFKYKSDNDYYNENYRKRYNEGYGDFIYDSQFDFANNTSSTEVIFSATTLYQATDTDKIYSAIYKKSNENAAEDQMDFNIRILQAQKISDVDTWKIENGSSNLGSLNVYGYAGHLYFNSSFVPINDINFGAPKEVFFTTNSYPTTNLFNAYYSDYMSEITDKDSKLLTCQALLDSKDILELDFSKMIWIDGVLFRINKVLNYNPMNYTTTKVELLKVIQKTF